MIVVISKVKQSLKLLSIYCYNEKTYIGEGEAIADVVVRLKETIRKRYELGDDDTVL